MQEQWIIRTNAIDNQNLFDSTACIVESGRKRNGALLNPSPVTIANELFRFVFEQHLIWSNEIQYLFIYFKYKHDENDMRAHDAYNSLTVMISILTYTPKKKKAEEYCQQFVSLVAGTCTSLPFHWWLRNMYFHTYNGNTFQIKIWNIRKINKTKQSYKTTHRLSLLECT